MTRTKQEAFDIAYRHLLTQMDVSEKYGTCLYRGPNGLMCAVGALIPNEAYRPEFDELCLKASDESVMMATGMDYSDISVGELLHDLQEVHDDYPPTQWAYKLRDVADKHDLTIPDMTDAA